jgi:hypothetical protein
MLGERGSGAPGSFLEERQTRLVGVCIGPEGYRLPKWIVDQAAPMVPAQPGFHSGSRGRLTMKLSEVLR